MKHHLPSRWPQDEEEDKNTIILDKFIRENFSVAAPNEKGFSRGRHGKQDEGEFVGRKLIKAHNMKIGEDV